MKYNICAIFLLFFAGFSLCRTALADNMIGDPTFERAWGSGAGGEIHDSRFMAEPFAGEEVALGIVGGRDRQGRWSTAIEPCEAGGRYRFEADFYRDDRFDSWAYPEVRIWGEAFRFNTHRMYGRYQRLFAEFDCPAGGEAGPGEFVFINSHPGTAFWMKNPALVEKETVANDAGQPHEERFYPLGVYGASAANLAQIKALGLNTAVIGFGKENIEACLQLGMHCTVSVPRDPERLAEKLDQVDALLRKGRFAFYVNDEPGIHSFSKEKSELIRKLLKERFPDSFTNMAIVRPQVVSEYEGGADYFMLDQYPVPNMPMVWLSDSMDEAAEQVGTGRLQSVIQAFGGEKYANDGWPRLPTFEEMNSLAYLSVVHGSRGIYFFTWPSITSTEQGREDFSRIVQRLNSMKSWLQVVNDSEDVQINMTSEYRYDPKGRDAVHCATKEQYGTRMLVCVNTLRTYTEAEVVVADYQAREWEDYFSGEPYYVVDDNVLLRFEPLEVKVLLETK